MKKTASLVLFLSLFLGSFAQTINRNNYFTNGNIYPYKRLSNLQKDSIHKAGANITWDFTSAITDYADTMYTLNPATTIFYNDPYTNYNLSTLALFEPLGMPWATIDDSLYYYIRENNDSVEFIGDWAHNGMWERWYYHYNNPEKQYEFPFSYGNSFTDSFAGSYFEMSILTFGIKRGRSQVTADGSGTLIMPDKTYNNCLRIKSFRIEYDSSAWGSGTDTTIFYTWFDPNKNGPILTMQNALRASTYIYAKYYFNNPSVGINEQKNSTTSFNVYPNPSKDNITIQFALSKNTATIKIFSTIGSLLKEQIIENVQNEKNAVKISTSDLSNGIYYVQLIIGNTSETKRFVVSK